MECPRCEQGNIYKGSISKNNRDIYVCDECDAYWFDCKNISVKTFGNLLELYRELELSPYKNHVEGNDYDWDKE